MQTERLRTSKTRGRSGLVTHLPRIPSKQNFAESESGAALVEFSIALLPLVALLLFTIDVAWAIFARATLQNAAREGVRFAVTGQVLPGNSCLGTSIQQVVSQNSFGFVPAGQAGNFVTVSYFSPVNLAPITDASGPSGGNVVQVSISGVSVGSLGPLWRSVSPVPLFAIASDVMESSPNGVTPCP